MKKVINCIVVDNCMAGFDSAVHALDTELRHALKKRVEGECSERDYITMAAKATAKFATFVAKDTSVNCEVINTMHKIFQIQA